MSDVKFTLPTQETVTIAGQSIDKLIHAGDGDAALLYLYILKTGGQGTSADASAALGKGAGWMATAMAVLSRLGLVRVDGKTGALPPDSHEEEPVDATRKYSIEDIKQELTTGSDFALVLEETQRSLGRILPPDDLLRLFGIYDALRLPPEVILQLVTHCISECLRSKSGRPPSLRYIEKAAYIWEREGIVTLERAEEHLKALDVRRSRHGAMKEALQIWDRWFSPTERRYVDSWVDMGFDAGAVAMAYDMTVVKTGGRQWRYLDSILRSWHSKGIHTAQEVMDKESRQHKGGMQSNTESAAQARKFGAADREEIARMERLLGKIKEG